MVPPNLKDHLYLNANTIVSFLEVRQCIMEYLESKKMPVAGPVGVDGGGMKPMDIGGIGKGPGKGGKGMQCWTCGGYGHRVSECKSKGKGGKSYGKGGKGFGKGGKGTGQGGKGFGKGGGKGSGKGKPPGSKVIVTSAGVMDTRQNTAQ